MQKSAHIPFDGWPGGTSVLQRAYLYVEALAANGVGAGLFSPALGSVTTEETLDAMSARCLSSNLIHEVNGTALATGARRATLALRDGSYSLTPIMAQTKATGANAALTRLNVRDAADGGKVAASLALRVIEIRWSSSEDATLMDDPLFSVPPCLVREVFQRNRKFRLDPNSPNSLGMAGSTPLE